MKVADILRQEAEKGNVDAQFAYAVMLLQGCDVPMEREKVVKLFASAAARGSVPAQMQVWLLS